MNPVDHPLALAVLSACRSRDVRKIIAATEAWEAAGWPERVGGPRSSGPFEHILKYGACIDGCPACANIPRREGPDPATVAESIDRRRLG